MHNLVVLVKGASVEQRSPFLKARLRLTELVPGRNRQVTSSVVVCSLRLVTNLDVVQLVQVITLEEIIELLISALLQLLELLFGPHVEAY